MELLLFDLDLHINEIVSPSDDDRAASFRIITEIERTGRTAAFLKALQQARPQTGPVVERLLEQVAFPDVPLLELLKLKPFEPETTPVPEGPFIMGREPGPGVRAHETPAHQVALEGYRIGKYPVTNEQYLTFVREKGIPVAPEMGWVLAPRGQQPPPDRKHHPVAGITWDEALAYCRWLTGQTKRSYRLPTEAEWEKAARGVEGRAYPWGNTYEPGRCNDEAAALACTSEVGSYSPQGDSFPIAEAGVADLSGNVWEWTSTMWGEDGASPEFAYPYDSADGRENAEPAAGAYREYRICRGGSFSDAPDRVAATARARYVASSRNANRGFRVVLDPSVSA